ncbi:MAG TPA: DMT family transporter [Chlamydiales bacterium]|nr:DMT family transporter [Chlamydiales bacterium]
MWLVFVLYALFASVFTISKEALAHGSPLFLVGSRMIIAGIALLGLEWFRGQFKLSFSRRAIQKMILLALVAIYLTNVLEFWGLKYLTSFKACFIYSLCPFASALFSYLLLNETLTPKKWLGLVVGFVSLTPILLNGTPLEEAAGQLWLFSWPELAVAGAALSSVWGWILLKQLVKEEGIAPMTANGVSMTLGGTIALIHSLFVESWQPIPLTNFAPAIACTALLIIISNFVCYNLYGYLLQRFSATFLSFSGLSTPLFCALFGWLAYGEVTNFSFWLSFIGVLFGLVVFYSEEVLFSQKAPKAATS